MCHIKGGGSMLGDMIRIRHPYCWLIASNGDSFGALPTSKWLRCQRRLTRIDTRPPIKSSRAPWRPTLMIPNGSGSKAKTWVCAAAAATTLYVVSWAAHHACAGRRFRSEQVGDGHAQCPSRRLCGGLDQRANAAAEGLSQPRHYSRPKQQIALCLAPKLRLPTNSRFPCLPLTGQFQIRSEAFGFA